MLSEVYNQNYLEVIIMQNSHEFIYKYMTIFSIKNFSLYNKKYGWNKGDDFLKQFAKTLSDNLIDTLIFRIFGDDFVILSKKTIDLNDTILKLNMLVNKHLLTYSRHALDLSKKEILSLNDIEMIYT